MFNNILATWRSGDAAACKAVYPGSIPGVASTLLRVPVFHLGANGKLWYIGSLERVILGSSVVEQLAVNQLVAGSNPARGATLFSPPQIFLFKPIRPLGSYRFQARAHIVSLL